MTRAQFKKFRVVTDTEIRPTTEKRLMHIVLDHGFDQGEITHRIRTRTLPDIDCAIGIE